MSDAQPIFTAYDVVVVGARVAGASTALGLARQGLSVLVVDRSAPGSDTLSTLALMRTGVLQLERLGLGQALVALGAPAITRTTFHYGRERVDVPIRPRFGVSALYAPRRSALDAMLVDAAREAGAEVRHRLSVTSLLTRGSRVTGVVVRDGAGATREIRASLVIGADGVRSHVARLAGSEIRRRGSAQTATLYGYLPGLDRDTSHWHYASGVAAGFVPTNDGRANLFVGMPARRFRRDIGIGKESLYRDVLREVSPELADHVSASGVEELRGFAGQPGHLRRAWGPGWALVGDAGYFRDPITAHGLSDALRDAELLSRAVAAGTEAALADYERVRDALSTPLLDVTEEIAAFQWDTETVKPMHVELSRAMTAESAHMAALPALEGPVSQVA